MCNVLYIAPFPSLVPISIIVNKVPEKYNWKCQIYLTQCRAGSQETFLPHLFTFFLTRSPAPFGVSLLAVNPITSYIPVFFLVFD